MKEIRVRWHGEGCTISFLRQEPSPYGGQHMFCYAKHEVSAQRAHAFVLRCLKGNLSLSLNQL